MSRILFTLPGGLDNRFCYLQFRDRETESDGRKKKISPKSCSEEVLEPPFEAGLEDSKHIRIPLCLLLLLFR